MTAIPHQKKKAINFLFVDIMYNIQWKICLLHFAQIFKLPLFFLTRPWRGRGSHKLIWILLLTFLTVGTYTVLRYMYVVNSLRTAPEKISRIYPSYTSDKDQQRKARLEKGTERL